jgi:putative nucleotidyltransferase with HDIG domain
MTGVTRLLAIIEEIAAGKYSNDIMELTRQDYPEPVRTIAEAMGLMMVKELEELNKKIRQNTINAVSAMAQALAARDAYTEGHVERVAGLAVRIARELGMQEEEIEYVRLGGMLHDIGKIGFSDLLFTAHETKNPPEVVKEILRHPSTGVEILQTLDFLGPALSYVHCHHERPDGKGYPRRLPDKEIPLGAKIVAVADAFDAMTTDRPYQEGKPPEVALGILKKHAGTKWDSACVAAFEVVMARSQQDPDPSSVSCEENSA